MCCPAEARAEAEERARNVLNSCLPVAIRAEKAVISDTINSALMTKATLYIINLETKGKDQARDNDKMLGELAIAEARVKEFEKERNEMKVKIDMAMAALKAIQG